MRVGDTRLEVVDEATDHGHGQTGAGDVEGGDLTADRIQVPATAAHLVADVIDVDAARTAKRHDAHEGLAEHDELRDLRPHALLDLFGGADDLAAALNVAIATEPRHDRPRARNQGAGTGACECRRGIHAADPVGRDKVLVSPQGLGVVHDDG